MIDNVGVVFWDRRQCSTEAILAKLFRSANELCGTFAPKLQTVKNKNDKVLEKNDCKQMGKTT